MSLIQGYAPKKSTYMDYDPELPAVFRLVKSEIIKVLPSFDTQHTGSSAIPGLGGRNKVDLLLIGDKSNYKDGVSILESIGFQDSGFRDIPEDRPMQVCSIEHENKTYDIHVHLTYNGSADHLNTIFFRDYLLTHPEARKTYGKIKFDAVQAGYIERLIYNSKKDPFIRSILDKRT
ncbi:MAG: GrpB family protein [Methylococcales bacterium]